MQAAYQTVRAYASDEFIERKSRFIGHIAPVSSEAEAQELIARIAKEHRDASHNVYAYLLRDGVSRCSDNGEPQGTGGVPVLDVLQKEQLTDVCAVVTRYFGGILLGTGGLVRSYSQGAKIAVNAAEIVRFLPCAEVRVVCGYAFYGKLTYMLPDFGVRTESSDFGAEITLGLLLRKERLEGFSKALTELSNGQVVPELLGERFAEMP